MNGDGRISFEEFVNGMRRMGGSTREKGGLLSASPVVTGAPFPNGSRKDYSAEDGSSRHGGEHGGEGDATGRRGETAALMSAADAGAGADERGEGDASSVAADAPTIDQDISHRPPAEPASLKLRSPADDVVGGYRHDAEAPSSAPHAAPTQDDAKVSGDNGDDGTAAASAAAGSRTAVAPGGAGDRIDVDSAATAARVSTQVVGEGSLKQSALGNGNGVGMSSAEGGRARIEGQGCGCVVA